MENPSELKVKSFRADDETFEKFKALASDEFGNQGQCLAALVNLYEIEKSKMVLGERKIEVETFQTHMNRLGELFLASLQLNQDAETRVRTEFERLLISKDKTIADLQGKISELAVARQVQDEAVKTAKRDFNEMFDKAMKFEKQVEQQDKEYASALADKDSLNKALTDSNDTKKAEVETLKGSLAALETHLMSAEVLEGKLAVALQDKERLISDLNKLKMQTEIDSERAVLNADKAHQQEMKEVYAQHHEEVREYISRIDRLQAQHDVQTQRISELERNQDINPSKDQPGK